jgi:exodeoxyribonuclease VII small subunit
MPKKPNKPTFEKDMERLEGIVAALEAGGLPLDDSLSRFEEGAKLVRQCQKALETAEKKIDILMKNASGELEAKPFGDETAEKPQNPVTQAQEDPIPEPPDEDEDELLF